MCAICEMPIPKVRGLPTLAILITKDVAARARKALKRFNLERKKQNLLPLSFNLYLSHLLTVEINRLAHAKNFDEAMRKAGLLRSHEVKPSQIKKRKRS